MKAAYLGRMRGQLEEAEKRQRKAIALVEFKGPSETLNRLNANLDGLVKKRIPEKQT
jgi:hypothetical protein